MGCAGLECGGSDLSTSREQDDQSADHKPDDYLANAERPNTLTRDGPFPRARSGGCRPPRKPITDHFSGAGVSSRRAIAPADYAGRYHSVHNSKEQGDRRQSPPDTTDDCSPWVVSAQGQPGDHSGRQQKSRGDNGDPLGRTHFVLLKDHWRNKTAARDT